MDISKFEVVMLDGTARSLQDFAGKVTLVVNVASRCGLTPQYGALEALQEKYQARGCNVLGMPSNQFMQELNSSDEIAEFCSTTWGVTFPMTEKIKVTEADAQLSEFTHSSLPVGSVWRREELLEWLVVTSDNRAAAALARTFPGGWTEFQYAMRALMTQMQLLSFDFGDSSGLSSMNKASARDLGVLLVTLSQLPWFQQLSRTTAVGGKMNVNRFAHDRSVGLLAGKTGFTSAAGYCLAEAERFGDKVYAMVVLKASGRESRAQDMNKLRRFTREQLT